MPAESIAVGAVRSPVGKRRALRALVCAGFLLVAGSFVPGESGLSVFGGEAHARCKSNLVNIYQDKFIVAKVITDWCYNGRSVTRRHSVPSARVRNFAYAAGVREAEAEWTYTACHTYRGIRNHNCLTKRQFAFDFSGAASIYPPAALFPRVGVCVATRIYGNGAHKRRITSTC